MQHEIYCNERTVYYILEVYTHCVYILCVCNIHLKGRHTVGRNQRLTPRTMRRLKAQYRTLCNLAFT